MPNAGDKFCYVSQDHESFTAIVKASYEVTKHDTCLKLGFVPIELVEPCDTGWVVRVPGALRIGNSGSYSWNITEELLGTLERIGDETMKPMAVEMWRIKRSMETLKCQAGVVTPTAPMTPPPKLQHVMMPKPDVIPIHEPEPKVEKIAKVKAEKPAKPIPEPWPEINAPKGIKVIRTYADGSQILDDGKERWLNADWTQPVKYVCR